MEALMEMSPESQWFQVLHFSVMQIGAKVVVMKK